MRKWFLLLVCSVLMHSPLKAFADTETEVGTWKVMQDSVLILKQIDGKKWLLQTTADRRSYVIRGKNFLTNKNVVLSRPVSPNEIANEETGLEGLFPSASGETPQGWPGEWWSSRGYVQNDNGEFVKGVGDESVSDADQVTASIENESDGQATSNIGARSDATFTGSARAETGSLITCNGDAFDPDGYLSVNPDLKSAGVDPCAHYTSHGKREGRSPNPKNIGVGTSGGRAVVSLNTCNGDAFDPDGYLSVNPDVKSAGVDPCTHYTSHGKREGRSPNPKNIGGGASGGGTSGGGTSGGNGGDDARVNISSSDGNGSYDYKYFPQPGVPQNAQEGVVKGLMPSHAIIATDSGSMDANAAVGVEYRLYDSTNKLIVYVRDTMGAYHPAFWSDEAKMKTYAQAVWAVWNRWRNNFRRFGPFENAIDRGNNHRDQFTVYLKPGNYRWEITNIGNTRIHFRADYVGERGGELFCEHVPKGESRNKNFSIQYSKDTSLKLNTNNYGNGHNCGD